MRDTRNPSNAVARVDGKDAFDHDGKILLTVDSAPKSGAARLTLHHRETLVAEAALEPGENRVALERIAITPH